ncbi:hypothetical protein CN931_14395 [Bacillus sp. AFS054943]|uniref:Uncharacterized protein n=1 Tax=Bacillus cereus TaxID=1396 RepID=A0A2C1LNA6_BACCE|nr:MULTISPECIES: hypothetical protein [Bacillus]PGL82592.1 hypothetical protein CN931_14395 [Bacillus sp. AFS054943]PGT99429.1 hypothetical protein COD19_19090 [Bacillus cereus]
MDTNFNNFDWDLYNEALFSEYSFYVYTALGLFVLSIIIILVCRFLTYKKVYAVFAFVSVITGFVFLGIGLFSAKPLAYDLSFRKYAIPYIENIMKNQPIKSFNVIEYTDLERTKNGSPKYGKYNENNENETTVLNILGKTENDFKNMYHTKIKYTDRNGRLYILEQPVFVVYSKKIKRPVLNYHEVENEELAKQFTRYINPTLYIPLF